MSPQLAESPSRAPARSLPTGKDRPVGICLMFLAAAVLTVVVAVYGLEYYVLDLGSRVLSARHPVLRPSGTLGRGLGVAGACLFLLVLLYPLRQRWPWLARQVNPRHWLDLHILFGLTAVAAITFHSLFKLRGIVGVAYW